MTYDFSKTLSENRQDWRIDRWMSKHGVKARDFDTHPCIDDLIKLINIRDYLWHRMNLSEQATWGAYWNIVFRQRKFLKEKFWAKMNAIVKNIDAREKQQTYARTYLKSRLKQNPKNTDHNKEAKGSNLSKVISVEMESQGGRQVLDIPPWE